MEMNDVLRDCLRPIAIAPRPRLERAKSHSLQAVQIDPALLERFGRSMRENFTSGSIPLRKAYL